MNGSTKSTQSKQGVIYTGGLCPPFARVAPSLAEQRLVVAADSGYLNAMAHNMPVDVLIGDFDSLGNIEAPSSIQRVPFESDKDETDTELAIDYCNEARCDSLLLVGGGGGTIDHLFALVWLFEGARRVSRWVTDTATIDYVDSHWSRADCRKRELISVLPVGRGPWQLQSTGLRWPLERTRWGRDNTGVRNEAVGAAVTITVARGALLVLHRFSQ